MKFSRRLRRSIYRNLLVIITFVLVIILSNLYQRETKNFFYKISEPFQRFFWSWGQKISFFFEIISEIKKLKEETERLKVQNLELMAEISLLREVKKENQTLRKALNLNLEKEFKLSLADVIFKDISEDLISLNRGKKDGIREGLPVITEQKILIGKIFEVYDDSSKVLLISNKKSSFDGEIAEKEIVGQVRGKGKGKVLFDLVPREKEIKEGDLIQTSTLGGIFPAGLLVGKLKKVEGSDVKPFWKAEILPLFEIGKLDKVFIILNFK